ncbi:hypothetical protein ACVWU4_000927 [Campylobacter coli]
MEQTNIEIEKPEQPVDNVEKESISTETKAEETKQESTTVNNENTEMYNRHEIVEVNTGKQKEISVDDVEPDSLVVPSISFEDNKKLLENISNLTIKLEELIELEKDKIITDKPDTYVNDNKYKKLMKEGIAGVLTEDTKMNMTNLLSTPTNLFNSGDVYSKNVHETEHCNSIKLGEAELVTKSLKHKDQKLTQARGLAALKSLLNLGEITQVPLWHSGFWVTLNTPTIKDMISLDLELTNSQVELGRQTTGLIYSNYNVIFNKIVINFIKRLIIDTSIKLDTNDDILDYINVQDLYPLVNGLISAMYPSGIKYVQRCANSFETQEEIDKLKERTKDFDSIKDIEIHSKCEYTVQGRLDAKKLLWVNRKVLDKSMLEHMSNRRPGSVSKTQVEEYVKSLKTKLNFDNVRTLKSEENDIDIKFIITPPSLNKYIREGEIWVEEVISAAQELYTDSDTDEDKNMKIETIVNTMALGLYGSYVNEIKIEKDGKQVEIDGDDLKTALAICSEDNKIYYQFEQTIKSVLEESAIAIVGMPTFICPKCQKDITGDNKLNNKWFKEIIPLNMLVPFFHLNQLRCSNIVTGR